MTEDVTYTSDTRKLFTQDYSDIPWLVEEYDIIKTIQKETPGEKFEKAWDKKKSTLPRYRLLEGTCNLELKEMRSNESKLMNYFKFGNDIKAFRTWVIRIGKSSLGSIASFKSEMVKICGQISLAVHSVQILTLIRVLPVIGSHLNYRNKAPNRAVTIEQLCKTLEDASKHADFEQQILRDDTRELVRTRDIAGEAGTEMVNIAGSMVLYAHRLMKQCPKRFNDTPVRDIIHFGFALEDWARCWCLIKILKKKAKNSSLLHRESELFMSVRSGE
jgi:hypothetical protein